MKKATKEWFDSAESDLLLIHEIRSNKNLIPIILSYLTSCISIPDIPANWGYCQMENQIYRRVNDFIVLLWK
jgi:hypothetical protein